MKRSRSFLILLLLVLFAMFSALWLQSSRKQLKSSSEKEPAPGTRTPAATSQLQSKTHSASSTNPSGTTNAAAASTGLTHNGTTTSGPGDNGQISASALKQIAALESEKAKRTPVQQKIDTQLLYADKMRRGIPIAEGVATQRVDLDKDEQDRVLVDIKADVTDALLQYVGTLGGKVINDFPQYQAIRAGVPLSNIEVLAARTEVAFIEPAVRAVNNTVDSQGDYTHQANTARTTFGVNGTGVKVGVLSDSVDNLSTSQIAGLVTVLAGQSGSPATGEGTAMLEIVNDLAPGAQLFFATGSGANSSEAQFAANIQALRFTNGCDIIVDDITYPDESPFQDGIIAQAVNAVTASGGLYFSSAANSGNLDSGTSGTWEGDFVKGGVVSSPTNGFIHSFGSANYDTVTKASSESSRTVLFWSDPWGASTNDYDLFVLDSTGSNIVSSSVNWQAEAQNPVEAVPAPTNGERLVIILASGTNRFLHIDTERGQLAIGTAGNTRGHNAATNAFTVAATPAFTAYGSGDPSGPYPNPFNSTDRVEPFSSDGPRRMFYSPNGTPITPGNFSSSGGAVFQKPDITAADGVKTDLAGFDLFYGTSAAAPHAAAIAALVKSYNTNLTALQIRTILTNTALDIMSAGVDRDSGAGIVMALAALEASAPLPNLTRFTDNLNNLSPHTGDVVTVSITVTNQPCPNGGTGAGAFHIGFYFSTSSSFSGVTPFYEAAVSGCAANGTAVLNQNITMSAAPGIYYLGYKINDEDEVTECNTGDNGIFYWTITVLPPPQPDLTKGTDNFSNLSPHAGDTITASLTITNEACTGGSTNAGAFHIGYYFSTSSSFSGATPFYEEAVNGCPANGTVSTNLNITINPTTTPGTYYLGYKIDDENEIAECNEGNNGIYYWTISVLSALSAPKFGGVSASGGKLITSLSGLVAGEIVILQVSTNLQTWTPIQTNNASGSALSITNTINPSIKSQFFRAGVE